MDVNDIDDGVESRLEDHVEAALAHLGGLCTVDAMPATQTLTQTRQLDVTRRRLGRIGNIATQNTDTGSASQTETDSGLIAVAIKASFALLFPSLRNIDTYEKLTSTKPSSCDLTQTGRVTTDEKHISSSVPSAHRT